MTAGSGWEPGKDGSGIVIIERRYYRGLVSEVRKALDEVRKALDGDAWTVRVVDAGTGEVMHRNGRMPDQSSAEIYAWETMHRFL